MGMGTGSPSGWRAGPVKADTRALSRRLDEKWQTRVYEAPSLDANLHLNLLPGGKQTLRNVLATCDVGLDLVSQTLSFGCMVSLKWGHLSWQDSFCT